MQSLACNLTLVGSFLVLADEGPTLAQEKKETTASWTAASSSARIAAALLDFDGALSILDELRRAEPQKSPDVEELVQDVQAARAAWTAIEARLEERKKDRKPITLAFPPNPREPQGIASRPYTLVDVGGRRLRLQAQGSKTQETRSLFSLAGNQLSELAGLAPGRAEAGEGLGLLILLHRGPEAARGVLLDPSVPEAKRKAAEARLESMSDLWIHARLEAVTRLAEEFKAASPSPSVDALEFLATDVTEVMAVWRPRRDYEKVRRKLRQVYITAREEAIKAAPTEHFFQAKEVKARSGSVELTYDFSSREQLEDFTRVKGLPGKLEWVKSLKAMKITGEVRFLDGNPFRNRIGVSAKATGFDPSAPNVNVALWTDAKDVVSTRPEELDLVLWRGREKGGGSERKDDFYAVGMGFKLDLGLEKSNNKDVSALYRSLKTFLPAYLREPSYILLGCAAGKCALRDPNDVIWDSSASNVLKGSFVFTAALDEKGKLDWTVNRRPLGFEASMGAKRLEAAGRRMGSLTFFTNGSTIQLSQVKIAGDLDPEWLATRAHGLAVHEVRELDGELTPAPVKKKTVEKAGKGAE